ncbi:MAG: NAD-dependent epimerase/dehydratase family protein [Gemmataceae bacterium]
MNVYTPIPPEVAQAGPVLVTGANGFLGANLVWTLRAAGVPVRAFVRRPPRGPQWRGLEDVEYCLGDICQPHTLRPALRGVSWVIHAAGCTEHNPRPRRLSFRINVDGTRNVCQAALEGGVRRLVYTSSIVTVIHDTLRTQLPQLVPGRLGSISSTYLGSKQRAEDVVNSYAGRGLDVIVLNPCYTIGPRDIKPTTNQFLLSAARYPLAYLPPGGMNVIDVREVALAHLRALWLGQPGVRYVLGGPYVTYKQLAAWVARLQGQPDRTTVIPRWCYLPGSLALAILTALCPNPLAGVSLPNFQYGFLPLRADGELALRTFQLALRPPEQSIWDTLRWFQDIGMAPWLRPLLPPPDWHQAPHALDTPAAGGMRGSEVGETSLCSPPEMYNDQNHTAPKVVMMDRERACTN